MIIEIVCTLLAASSGSLLGYTLHGIIKGTKKTSATPSISPEEATELRNKVELIGLEIKSVDLKIEGQLKPQIEKHHAGLLTLNGDIKHLYDVLNGSRQ